MAESKEKINDGCPFLWQDVARTKAIRARVPHRQLAAVLCLYKTLTDIARDQWTREYTTYVASLATMAGLSLPTARKALRYLEARHVVAITRHDNGSRAPMRVVIQKGAYDAHAVDEDALRHLAGATPKNKIEVKNKSATQKNKIEEPRSNFSPLRDSDQIQIEDVVVVRAREGVNVVDLDEDVYGALSPHIAFGWNGDLLRLYVALVQRHQKDNVLLAITEAVKSCIPPANFYRYIAATLEEQAKLGYTWTAREAKRPGPSAAFTPVVLPDGRVSDGRFIFES